MLYPEMFGEVLAFHERETSWVGAGSPVPVRVSAVGEVWALLAKLSVALADPVLCGLNVTVNGRLWPDRNRRRQAQAAEAECLQRGGPLPTSLVAAFK